MLAWRRIGDRPETSPEGRHPAEGYARFLWAKWLECQIAYRFAGTSLNEKPSEETKKRVYEAMQNLKVQCDIESPILGDQDVRNPAPDHPAPDVLRSMTWDWRRAIASTESDLKLRDALKRFRTEARVCFQSGSFSSESSEEEDACWVRLRRLAAQVETESID